MHFCQVSKSNQIAAARQMFEEYAAELGIDLGFQGFAAELAGLPGMYAPPRGRLLLAEDGERSVGCVALRPLGESICEMKRLYVRPEFRRDGLGRRLAQGVIAEARAIGYFLMRLDTLSDMEPAIGLYESQGFVRCSAYYNTPLVNTVFMELAL